MENVWIQNPYPLEDTLHFETNLLHTTRPLFIPGVLLDKGNGSSRTVQSLLKPRRNWTVQNAQIYPRSKNVHTSDKLNLADLVFSNDASVLDCLYQRYISDGMYLFAGEVLISINPYRDLTTKEGLLLYSEAVMKSYRTSLKHLPPHVFKVAERAVQRLQRKRQVVIVSGQSGAGKSEATKVILQYVTNTNTTNAGSKKSLMPKPARTKRRTSMILGSAQNPFQGSASTAKGIEAKILCSNPVLEAFGNAKTARNENSSRFGKLIQIYFDDKNQVVGGEITTYLLEKCRVNAQQSGGRNYHIFYQMVIGMTDEERLKYHVYKSAEQYEYLSLQAKSDQFWDDYSDFHSLRKSLTMINIHKEEESAIFKMLSAILLIGNIKFQAMDADRAIVCPEARSQIDIIENLLGIRKGCLEKHITTRHIQTSQDTTEIPLTKTGCVQAKDSLAKTIYNNLFHWIVQQINKSLLPQLDTSMLASIGVLDIFGFEVFEKNGFEQLCINYANEKLHQFFAQVLFKEELRLYAKENVDSEGIEFEDNAPIIHLIDQKPSGLLWILEESCLFPNGSDDHFLQKVNHLHENHQAFKNASGKFRYSFLIQHSAATIQYDVTGFVEKNKDQFCSSMQALLSQSELPLMASCFPMPDADNLKKSGKVFLASEFRKSINALTVDWHQAEPHFIKCIKPNAVKKAFYFDQEMVCDQCHYLGVIDAINLRRTGYRYRSLFVDFYQRYSVIDTNRFELSHVQDESLAKPECKQLVANFKRIPMLLHTGFCYKSPVVVGDSLVFMKHEAFERLEKQREWQTNTLSRYCIWIQNAWRVTRRRRRRARGIISITKMQARARSQRAKRRYRKIICSILVVQSLCRRNVQLQRFRIVKVGIILLQRRFCNRREIRKFCICYANAVTTLHMLLPPLFYVYVQRKRKNNAAIRIQAYFRGCVARAGPLQKETLQVRTAMERVHEQFSCRSIQTAFRCHVAYLRFKNMKNAARIVQQHIKGNKLRRSYAVTLNRIILVQARAKGYLQRTKEIRTAMQSLMLENQAEIKARNIVEARTLTGSAFNDPTGCDVQVCSVHCNSDTTLVYPKSISSCLLSVQKKLASSDADIYQVEVSSTHAVVLDTTKRLTCFGWNDKGQLGKKSLPEKKTMLSVHYFLKELKLVCMISTGKDFTLALDELGDVYSWGANSVGQLGLGTFHDFHTPSAVRFINKAKIVKIATGNVHSVAISSKFECFTWGESALCGQEYPDNITSISNVPRKLRNFTDRIVDVCCGSAFVVALTDQSHVYTWGETIGCLAKSTKKLIDHRPKLLPTKDIESPPTRIVSGSRHAALLTENGEVYTWGDNASGQLGHGDHRPRIMPCRVQEFSKHKVESICAGHSSMMAMVPHFIENNNLVYRWGKSGIYLNESEMHESSTPVLAQTVMNSKKLPFPMMQASWSDTVSFILLQDATHNMLPKDRAALFHSPTKKSQQEWTTNCMKRTLPNTSKTTTTILNRQRKEIQFSTTF